MNQTQTKSKRQDKPRICFISLSAYHYFNSDVDAIGGGAQRQVYLLTQSLKSAFDVHMVVGDYAQPETEVRDGVTLHRAYKPAPHVSSLRAGKKMWKLFTAIRRADSELYIFRGFPHKAGLLNVYFKILRRPWIYCLSSDSNVKADPERMSSYTQLLFRRALKDSSRVIAQNEYQSDQLSKEFGKDSTIIPNGYPTVNGKLSYSDREFFLWVGNIHKEKKRPHIYIDVAYALPDQEFVIIGPNKSSSEYYDQFLNNIDHISNLHYPGTVDPETIHKYFERAYALVNTSPTEGFPNTFLEAWRYSTPVVSLSVDPGRYVDFPGPTGYMSNNRNDLVDAIARIADKESYWHSLSEPANCYFEENFRMEKVAERYIENINSVIRAWPKNIDPTSHQDHNSS